MAPSKLAPAGNASIGLLLLLLLLLLPALCTSTSCVEKKTHLRFFFHDVPSGPSPTTVRVAQDPSTTRSPTSFGDVIVFDDALTEGPDPSSKLVGRAQGMYVPASKEEQALLMAMNFAFVDGKFNGSSLAVLGRNSKTLKEMPVVGGSGKFRFARGYAVAKTLKFNPLTGDAVVEYNVHVLHYPSTTVHDPWCFVRKKL